MNAAVISNHIYEEILLERHLQDQKWGVQDHPSLSPNIIKGPNSNSAERANRHYGLPPVDKAKYVADEAAKKGDLTWSHIAVEELAEVVSADNDIHRRHELVQLAAVCVAWIESLDRKMEKEKNGNNGISL